MGDYPYQPTLLSLQDMLNLSDNEDDGNWSSNPYNISNFFEPISPTKPAKNKEPSQIVGEAASTSSIDPAAGPSNPFSLPILRTGSEDFVFNPFFSPPKKRSQGEEGRSSLEISSSLSQISSSSATILAEVKAEFDDDDADHLRDEDFLNIFHETEIASELKDSKTSDDEVDDVFLKEAKATAEEVVAETGSIETLDNSKKDLETKLCSPILTSSSKSTLVEIKRELKEIEDKDEGEVLGLGGTGTPTLKEVKSEGIEVEENKPKLSAIQRKHKKEAIEELDRIIASLKRYSKLLENFLDEEGDLIMEHYSAQTLLKDILPEMEDEPSTSARENPLEAAHTFTKLLVNHLKGETALASLPPRKAYLWRGSELLMLQKSVLQSTIAHREFLLNCRYTELLTEMGFDSEDLVKLRNCTTREAEQGIMKIIKNDHSFFSKLKHSYKKPIQNIVIRNQHGTDGIPRVFVLPTPERLIDDKWKCLREIRSKTALSNLQEEDIDWLHVVKAMCAKNPKLRIDVDTCKLMFNHYINPKTNNLPWHLEELKRLRELRQRYPYVSWPRIAELLETNRAPFSCFVKFKSHCYPTLTKLYNYTISPPVSRIVSTYLVECCGDLNRLDYKLRSTLPRSQHSGWMTPRRLVGLCQRKFNSRLRRGRFSVVEDVLLLIVMEKYRDYLLENEGAMEPVAYALPWRYITFWRLRFGVLMTNFFFKNWTLEEDKMLWSLVEQNGPNYKIIQRYFPLKNRKQCRDRYQRLQKIACTTTLEDYHMLYNCRRKGVCLERLNEVAKYLEATIQAKQKGGDILIRLADLEFLKLRLPPSDSSLEKYLLTFPIKIMERTLLRLSNCLIYVLSKMEEFLGPQCNDKGGISKMNKELYRHDMAGFNRRNFDPSCPASVASALQIRNAPLIPQEKIDRITNFESDVYHYYKYFNLKGKVKNRTRRTGIPSLAVLRKLSCISRIVEPAKEAGVLHPKGSRGEPNFPFLIVPGPMVKVKETEGDIMHELEERRKGGRRKGVKRKKTEMREQKRMAAMTRWKSKSVPEERELVCFKDENESPCSLEYDPLTPATPSTPGASLSSADGDTASMVSIGSGSNMRNAILGMIGDHSYIAPMYSPSEYYSLPLPQLFAKMSEIHMKRDSELCAGDAKKLEEKLFANAMKCSAEGMCIKKENVED